MRLAFHIAIILSILYAPWWASAVLIACAAFLFERFYGAVVYGILIDALFATEFGYKGFSFMATLFGTSVLILASLIRNRLAW